MPTRRDRNTPVPKATGADTPPSSPPESATPAATKAQAEFQRYKARLASDQAAAAQIGGQVYMVPIGYPPTGAGMPGWALPPSLAALTPPPGFAGFGPALGEPGMVAEGSLLNRLGSALRLGIDVVNAALAGSAKMLGAAYGMTSGYGQQEWGQTSCGCHSCCDGCCSDCGGNDCCGCESCCSPRVGTCC